MKILLTDDSKVIRHKVRTKLSTLGEFTFVEADSGEEAIRILDTYSDIDAVILDINMDGIDGITTMQFVNDKFNVPCIIYSSFTKKNVNLTFEAIELGAYDVIHKPHGISNYSFSDSILRIKSTLDQIGQNRSRVSSALRGLIVIGMSTGGPKTIREILPSVKSMPYHSIIIVQHMPESFIPSFAESMNNYAQLDCSLALDGAQLEANKVYLAQGGKNLTLINNQGGIYFKLEKPTANQHFTPMIDKTMSSASEIFGRNVLSIVLTGMGRDGSLGAKEIKKAGGKVIVESADSCIVNGMPKATKELVSVDGEYHKKDIASVINNYANEKDVAA